jgi:hypothetical protein
MVAMNDIILYTRNQILMSLSISPESRRITFFHLLLLLLVLLLPAVGALFVRPAGVMS